MAAPFAVAHVSWNRGRSLWPKVKLSLRVDEVKTGKVLYSSIVQGTTSEITPEQYRDLAEGHPFQFFPFPLPATAEEIRQKRGPTPGREPSFLERLLGK